MNSLVARRHRRRVPVFRGRDGAGRELLAAAGVAPDLYYEAVVIILAFVLTGRWLEARARHQAATALQGLARLQPREALVLGSRAGNAPCRSSRCGWVRWFWCGPAGRIPLDGVVTEGQGDVDESVVSGESLPIAKAPSQPVTAGTLLTSGALFVRVTAEAGQDTLSRIVELMRDAQLSRAPIQRLADRVSAIFVPVVLALAAVTFVAWWLAGGQGGDRRRPGRRGGGADHRLPMRDGAGGADGRAGRDRTGQRAGRLDQRRRRPAASREPADHRAGQDRNAHGRRSRGRGRAGGSATVAARCSKPPPPSNGCRSIRSRVPSRPYSRPKPCRRRLASTAFAARPARACRRVDRRGRRAGRQPRVAGAAWRRWSRRRTIAAFVGRADARGATVVGLASGRRTPAPAAVAPARSRSPTRCAPPARRRWRRSRHWACAW